MKLRMAWRQSGRQRPNQRLIYRNEGDHSAARWLEKRGRKFQAICDFNLIEKYVRCNTVVPSNINKLTPQVINDALNSPLRETPDQPFVCSDLSRGATPHADLVLVERLRTPPSNYLRRRGRGSMPCDLFVHNNRLTIFVHLDDWITPARFRFHMSQLAPNFRRVWINPSEQLIWQHRNILLPYSK
jgi:hypothetical protein